MFCPMEQVELRINTCPVECLYRTPLMKCGFTELTDEHVDVNTIARVKDQKVYKVRAQITTGRQMIEIGMTIDKYADYIRQSYPKLSSVMTTDVDTVAQNTGNTVNTRGSNVSATLRNKFQLTDNQQKEFWSEERFSIWSTRNNVKMSLSDIRQALLSI